MIEKELLVREYRDRKKSVRDIAGKLECSENKVTYWLQKHNVKKRTISEALYTKLNPKGDPFSFTNPTSSNSWLLYGLGLGLFWGEGNKANKNSVRLGNTDPDLIRVFLVFLDSVYKINHSRLRFGLQIFSDCSPDTARAYWCRKLSIKPSQFQKVVITQSRKKGTYRTKNQHGVLTIYFSNTKLRDTIVSAIERLRTEI